jgi:hypothetical protein
MFKNYDIHDRNQVTFHLLITLQTPLSHIGEVTGNVSNLKTLKLIDLTGQPRQCFVYSGNALRNGILRRKGVASALDRLNLKVNPDTHHTMFAGGRIDGSTASDMGLDKKIRQILPWLSVLGTAKPVGVFGSNKSQMVQGRINVGSAYLICFESLRYLYQQCKGFLEHSDMIKDLIESEFNNPFSEPDNNVIAKRQELINLNIPFLRKHYKSWTEFITIDQTTRRASIKDPLLLPYLTQETNFLEGDKKEEKEKKSDQMIASDRLIMAGSKLYSRWDFNGTNIEEGFIYDALLEFAKSPYLGGKGNRGNGLVSIEIWYNTNEEQGHLLSIGTDSEIVTERVTNQLRSYQDYLTEYREFLDSAKDGKEIKNLLGA